MHETSKGRKELTVGQLLAQVCRMTGHHLRTHMEKLGLHRIFATCDTGNEASSRVLEKTGMRREAHFRQDNMIRGKWRDSYLYAVLEDEWSESGKEQP